MSTIVYSILQECTLSRKVDFLGFLQFLHQCVINSKWTVVPWTQCQGKRTRGQERTVDIYLLLAVLMGFRPASIQWIANIRSSSLFAVSPMHGWPSVGLHNYLWSPVLYIELIGERNMWLRCRWCTTQRIHSKPIQCHLRCAYSCCTHRNLMAIVPVWTVVVWLHDTCRRRAGAKYVYAWKATLRELRHTSLQRLVYRASTRSSDIMAILVEITRTQTLKLFLCACHGRYYGGGISASRSAMTLPLMLKWIGYIYVINNKPRLNVEIRQLGWINGAILVPSERRTVSNEVEKHFTCLLWKVSGTYMYNRPRLISLMRTPKKDNPFLLQRRDVCQLTAL
jgi:hypothetical protein